MDSILISISKLLGMEADYTYFDPDVMININSALFSLNQLGIGPTSGLMISSAETKWTDLLGDRKDMEAVKLYIYLKTRLGFDPPTSTILVETMERQIRELEWRLNVQVESTTTTTTTTTVEGGTVNG